MNTLNEMNQTHTTLMNNTNMIIEKLKQQLAETDQLLKESGINLDEEV